MVSLGKTQSWILFETCDLGVDSGKLTLKSRKVSPRTRRPFRLLALHNAPHMRSHASAPLEEMLGNSAGDDVAPPDFCLVRRDYPDSEVLRLSESQQSGMFC